MTSYKWSEPVNIVGNSFVGKLVSDYEFIQTLIVNIDLLATPKGDTVSVSWNFENQTLANKTFKLPDEVVNMNQWKISNNKVSLK